MPACNRGMIMVGKFPFGERRGAGEKSQRIMRLCYNQTYNNFSLSLSLSLARVRALSLSLPLSLSLSLPDRVLYLLTLSHLSIVKNVSLSFYSLSRARSLSLSLSRSLSLGIPTPRESGSVIGPDRTVWALLCVAEGVPQGQTESGGIVLAVICWSLSAQRRCYPTGFCAYRPSVSS